MSRLSVNLNDKLQEDISRTVNEYAQTKGYNSGNHMEEEIQRQLGDPNPEVRGAGNAAAIDTIKSLSPKIFTQIVDNFGARDVMTEHMEVFYWGIYNEGNIASIFSNLPPAPSSTGKLNTSTPFIPSEFTSGYNQSWDLNYVDPNNPSRLAPEAYAFSQDIVYQQTSLLTQFRTGAGIKFLIEMNLQLYESLKYLQYFKWAKTLFTLPSNTTVNGRQLVFTSTKTNSFEAWVEISEILNKMTALNNHYNYNGSFQRMHSLKLSDMILYMSRKTKTTLMNNLKSQLYNNGNFTQIIDQCTIVTPEYKLKWKNITSSAITVGSTSVAANTTIDPVMGLDTIPRGLIWVTSDEEWVDDTQVFIASKYSMVWMKQAHLEASQFFANNFSELSKVYELGLMSMRPDAKFLVYKNANLNRDINAIDAPSYYLEDGTLTKNIEEVKVEQKESK